jgi:hypothetical protein
MAEQPKRDLIALGLLFGAIFGMVIGFGRVFWLGAEKQSTSISPFFLWTIVGALVGTGLGIVHRLKFLSTQS